jgi:SpoIIAA-like
MIERIEGMPAGVVGFRASGEVSAEDYRTVLEPALREAVESGEVRMLYLLPSDVKMDAGAMLQDAKTGLDLGIGHHSAWRRTAIVTDIDWVRKALRAFAWMAPGEVKAFAEGDLEAARAWVAA